MAMYYSVNMASIQSPWDTPSHGLGDYMEMPMSFYHLPDSAEAVCSTLNGRFPKRAIEEPLPLPIARSNFNQDVIQKAEMLRERLPSIARSITAPNKWEDLYQFFDGYDLYVNGAAFCFYVISEISRKNEDLAAAFANEISKYAAEWIDCHKQEVLCNPPTLDLVAFFLPEELEGLKVMTANEIRSLGVALDQHRCILLDGSFRQRPLHPLYPVIERSHNMAVPYIPQTQIIGEQQGIYHGPRVSVAPNMSPGPNSSLATSTLKFQSYPPCQTHSRYMQSTQHYGGSIDYSLAPQESYHNNMNLRTPIGPREMSLSNGNYQAPNGVKGFLLDNENIHAQSRPRGMSDIPHSSYGSSKSNYASSSQSSRRTVSNTPRPSPSKISKSEGAIWVHTGQTQPSSSRDRVPRHISSSSNNSRFSSISNDARVLESMNMHGRRSFGSSSRATAPMGTPREPRNHGESSIPLDIPFANDPNAMVSLKGASTYFYSGQTKYVDFDEQCPRTVYVRNVDRNLFASHKLHRMMQECGEVESITYVAKHPPTGAAFVAFMQVASVEQAIWRFNGFQLASGETLAVSPSRPRGRERANSQFSQGSYGSSRSVRPARGFDGYHPPTRHNTVQPPILSYNQCDIHVTSPPTSTKWVTDPTPLKDVAAAAPAVSAMSEVVQHQAALNRLTSQLPLNPVQNLPKPTRRSNFQGQWVQTCAQKPLDKYENRESRTETPTSHTVPNNESPLNKRSYKPAAKSDLDDNYIRLAGRKKNKTNGYKQNTYFIHPGIPKSAIDNNSGYRWARPTPAVSPVKARTVMSLDRLGGPQHETLASEVKPGSAIALQPSKIKHMDSGSFPSNNSLPEHEPKQEGWKPQPKKTPSTLIDNNKDSPSVEKHSSTAKRATSHFKSPSATIPYENKLVSAKSMTSISNLSPNENVIVTSAKSDTNLCSAASKFTNQKSALDLDICAPGQHKLKQNLGPKKARKGNIKECKSYQRTHISSTQDNDSYLNMRQTKRQSYKGFSDPCGDTDGPSGQLHLKDGKHNDTPWNFNLSKASQHGKTNIGMPIHTGLAMGPNQRMSLPEHEQIDLSNNDTGDLQKGTSSKGDDLSSQSYGKKASIDSSTNNGFTQISNPKATTVSNKIPNTLQRSQSEAAISKQPQQSDSTAKIMRDPKQWPTLSLNVSPQGVTVDGEPATPAPSASSVAPRQAPNLPIVPAVPLLKNIRPQP